MKYIGWMGCLGFALVGLFQQSVISSMEQSYMNEAKNNVPILRENDKKSKTIKKSSYTETSTIDTILSCPYVNKFNK